MLQQKCLDNVIEYWDLLAKTANGVIINNSFMHAAIMGVDSGIFNAVLKFNPHHYDKIKSEISSQCKNNSLPISFWLDENIDPSDKNFFESLKLSYFGYVPLMLIKTDTIFSAPIPEDIKIIKYESANLDRWMEPFSVAFNFNSEIAATLKQVLEKIPEKFCHFVAVHNDRVVACASVFMAGEIAGFYNLGTLPEYRNKGVATALHHARLEFAKMRGFKYATLQATPMATQLDTKLGFERVGGFHIYLDKI